MEVAAERLSHSMPEAFHGDAHALLMCVYKDPTQPIAVRIEAAGKAIGYEKPKLAAQRVDMDVTHSFSHLSDAELYSALTETAAQLGLQITHLR
jgi:hypothetical protein